ncbi:hypothetical protein BLNAU_16839 [Blattamonas nauphoetae]|uniref:Uncharacterized protein n=1 Tax=Blattamonas nauphoetae TaxID=2049346 RepID=A0ABQ9XDC8_9EUKA|nr:hypothetical protein BLNAU_16839 [Blattamonas nauphoetae]
MTFRVFTTRLERFFFQILVITLTPITSRLQICSIPIPHVPLSKHHPRFLNSLVNSSECSFNRHSHDLLFYHRTASLSTLPQNPVISAREEGFKPCSCFFSECTSLLLTVSTLIFIQMVQ